MSVKFNPKASFQSIVVLFANNKYSLNQNKTETIVILSSLTLSRDAMCLSVACHYGIC